MFNSLYILSWYQSLQMLRAFFQVWLIILFDFFSLTGIFLDLFVVIFVEVWYEVFLIILDQISIIFSSIWLHSWILIKSLLIELDPYNFVNPVISVIFSHLIDQFYNCFESITSDFIIHLEILKLCSHS